MVQSIRSARTPRRALFTPLLVAALAACGPDGEVIPLPERPQASSVQVLSRTPPVGVAGQRLPDTVVIRSLDAQGQPVAGARFSLGTNLDASIIPMTGVTDADGYIKAVWELGSEAGQRLTISVEGATLVNVQPRLVDAPEPARPMLGLIIDYMTNHAAGMERDLPRNPWSTLYMQAKIELLRTPGLGSDIVEQGRYEVASITSRSGQQIPVVAAFPLEVFRQGAVETMGLIQGAVPVLESFFDGTFPAPREGAVRLWYGFVVGQSGGGGMVSTEDRGSYVARTSGRPAFPFESGIIHELGHSYVGTESLAQFLEIYGDNVLRTGSPELSTWTYTRNWTPQRAENQDVHALLDVYQLIGPEAMMRAFRAVVPLRPPYGQPLSAAAQQVFVDAAPEALRPQVAAKMAKITF